MIFRRRHALGWILLAALLVAGGGWIWRHQLASARRAARERLALEHQLSTARHENLRLQQAVADALQRARRAEDRLAVLETAPATPASAAPARHPPAANEAYGAKHLALFEQLDLHPADLRQFQRLLAEKEAAFRDVLAVARSRGLDVAKDREEIQRIDRLVQDMIDRDIRSVLGDAKYLAYRRAAPDLPPLRPLYPATTRASAGDGP